MKKFNLIIIFMATIAIIFFITSTAFGTDALKIDASGNVGIGATSPGAKLDVANRIRLDTESYGMGFISSNANTSFLNIGGGTSYYNGGYAQIYGTGFSITSRQGDVWLVSNTAGSGGGNIKFLNFNGSSTWSTRMTITSSGNVGIGTTSPSYLLELSSNSAAKPSGGSWSSTSDIRLKTDVKNLTNAAGIIMQYPRPILFKWKNPEEHENITREIVGLSAQELEKANPDMVIEAEDTSQAPEIMNKDSELTGGRTKAIFFSNEFFALQLGAVQELIERVETLETENQLIKNELCKKDNSYSFCKER